MAEHRAGGYVEAAGERARERRSLNIVLSPPPGFILISGRPGGTDIAEGGLGFDDNVALNAKRAFANELYELSRALDRQIVSRQPELPDAADPTYERQLCEALTLTQGESLLRLQRLRTYGQGLRTRLSRTLVTKLRNFGFPQADARQEPAITFTNHQQAPILWDMMYEEPPGGKHSWENFWGFRVPITHWEVMPRPDRIRMREGIFSAVDQSLSFASSEVALLVQRFKSGLAHCSFADVVKAQVRQELCALLNNDDAQIEAWLASQPPDSWLSGFLQKLIEGKADASLAEYETMKWKEDTIEAIFAEPRFTYDLVHFACHCEPGRISELDTRLNINIAGAEMALNVAAMGGAREWGSEEPGPLVFLNACGTGQQGGTNEPPGFPGSWIRQRGALAVVATLCPVPDLFAHAFALKFYGTLFGAAADPAAPPRQRYLGEALLETRRFFMEECGNPLGLAYVLYAVQDARVEVEF